MFFRTFHGRIYLDNGELKIKKDFLTTGGLKSIETFLYHYIWEFLNSLFEPQPSSAESTEQSFGTHFLEIDAS